MEGDEEGERNGYDFIYKVHTDNLNKRRSNPQARIGEATEEPVHATMEQGGKCPALLQFKETT